MEITQNGILRNPDENQRCQQMAQVKVSHRPSAACLITTGVIILALLSIGLNIYFGIKVHQLNDLSVEKSVVVLSQDCQIESYQISVVTNAGVILNIIPQCAKKNSTSRLLSTCAVKTTKGQCLYCTKMDSKGACIEYSNDDPNTSNNDPVQAYIKCLIDNIEVIQYGIESCAEEGLENMMEESVSEFLNTGEIAGISAGSGGGLFIIIGIIKKLKESG